MISFVVPVYDTIEFLADVIGAIQRQNSKHAFEIILVDNNCPFDLLPFLQGTPLPLIFKEPRQGVSFARNAGVARAAGEYIAFIDSDCVVSNDWLHHSHTRLTTLPAIVAVVQTAIVPSGNPNYFLNQYRLQYSGALTNGTFSHFSSPTSYPTLNTAALLMKREAFEAVQGFDESLSRLEDTDMTFRLLEKGFFVAISTLAHAKVYNNHASIYKYLKRSFLIGLHSITLSRRWSVPSATYHFATLHFDRPELQLFHFLSSAAKWLGAHYANLTVPKTSLVREIASKANRLYLLTTYTTGTFSYSIKKDWRLFIFEDRTIAMDFANDCSIVLRESAHQQLNDFLEKKLSNEETARLKNILPFIQKLTL